MSPQALSRELDEAYQNGDGESRQLLAEPDVSQDIQAITAGLRGAAVPDAEANGGPPKNSMADVWPKQMASLESLNFEANENAVFRGDLTRQKNRDSVIFFIVHWSLLTLLGMNVALLAYFVALSVENIALGKFRIVDAIHETSSFLAYVVYCLINCVIVLGAALLCVYLAPAGAGSGIAEVKAHLNGVDVPGVFLFRTLVAKCLGMICSTSAGLALGKEGPFIHMGAIVASLLGNAGSNAAEVWRGAMKTFSDRGGTVGRWATWVWHLPGVEPLMRALQRFKMDVIQRDLIAAGSASGVAAAFRSPVGGTLFALEEVTSFWNNPVLWRAFYTNAIVMLTLRGLLNFCSNNRCGFFSVGGFIIFEIREGQTDFSLKELFPLFLLGVTGGIMGSLFTVANMAISRWRRDVLPKYGKRGKLLEALAIAFVTSTCSFMLCKAFWCTPCPPGSQHCPGEHNYISFQCPDGHYNEMATLFFNTHDNIIRNLFAARTDHEFSVATLLTFFLFYYVLAIWTAGSAIPAGLFVPSIILGAAYGRIIGIYMSDKQGTRIDEGTYALLGAASFLAGMMRMTVSLCVILLEVSNNLNMLTLLMSVLLVAKAAGDATGVKGIYDAQIQVKRFPVLEQEPEKFYRVLTASDVATAPVRQLKRYERVGDLLTVMGECSHNGFPVIEYSDEPIFLGVVLRQHILFIIRDGTCLQTQPGPDTVAIERMSSINFMDLCKPTSTKGLSMKDIQLSTEQSNMWLDLAPLVNPCPYVVQSDTSLTKVFALFRTMGLRHLCVVPHVNDIVGVITRKDLIELVAEHKLREKVEGKAGAASNNHQHHNHRLEEGSAHSGTVHRRARSLLGSGILRPASPGLVAPVPSTPALRMSATRRSNPRVIAMSRINSQSANQLVSQSISGPIAGQRMGPSAHESDDSGARDGLRGAPSMRTMVLDGSHRLQRGEDDPLGRL